LGQALQLLLAQTSESSPKSDTDGATSMRRK
jgi:hypothetical protein